MIAKRAIKRLTSEPAEFFGINDRGLLKVGKAADITLINYATVGSATLPDQRLNDLPTGGARLHSAANGIAVVIVNGRILYQDGEYVGGLPGQLLRAKPGPAVGDKWLELAAG